LGDIIGGIFEEVSYQKQVLSQSSNSPQITEKSTTVTKMDQHFPQRSEEMNLKLL